MTGRSQRLFSVAAAIVVLFGCMHFFSDVKEKPRTKTTKPKKHWTDHAINYVGQPESAVEAIQRNIGDLDFLKDIIKVDAELGTGKDVVTGGIDEGSGKTLCFHVFRAEERGSDVATYDYADFAEVYYGYQSKILIPDKPESHNGLSLDKYRKRFGKNVVFYKPDVFPINDKKSELLPGRSFPYEAKRLGCNFVYILKAGDHNSVPRYPDAFNSSIMRMGVHAVFNWQPHHPSIPYAAISAQVAKFHQDRDVVPHIVRPPQSDLDSISDLRDELKIPEKAMVVCRHGGMNSFDVSFVHHAVFNLLSKYPNGTLHFVFLGTKPFTSLSASSDRHPFIHHLPSNADMEYKERFFKTCDVMLHARMAGETFGLAVAEFSVRNKPVVTYSGLSVEHIRIMKEKCFVFSGASQLVQIMSSFVEKGVDKSRDYNAYREYAPRLVMKQFKKVFLDPVFNSIS